MILQIEPWIDDDELFQLKRVISNKYVTENELTEEFESKIKKITNSKHAISMANGTLALYVSLKALGIGYGDEVIVPNITFIASANAIIMAGAKPVFCEVDPVTYCIDCIEAEKLCNKNTKAIMPVHLYGQSADMTSLIELSKKENIYIIEDAAQGIGVKFHEKHVGTFGDIGVLSFYGNKTITCGEGGIILTNNDSLAKICYMLKNHGRERKGIFIHNEIGFNFAFTEMQAAIGIAQLNKLERIINKKKFIHDYYFNSLKDLKSVSICKIDPKCSPVYWFTSYEIYAGADSLSSYLNEHEIQTRRFFYPLNKQPCYLNHPELGINLNRNFSLSEKIYKNGLSLPSSYSLTLNEQNFIIEKIRSYYEYRI